ncbi:MAG: PHP domain-containing protein [Lachnospiraceae bacterium]|nr:PHP domain-containing protein [Lachnospiraceae bacterium]
MITVGKNDVFHVHTYRCRHAENIPDRDYVEKAIELGAKGIWFTDHAPFPGDPFNRAHRMLCEELPEYLDTLKGLKQEFADRINIHIGLETEYFRHFDEIGYYKQLLDTPDIEMLLLGQHMAELPQGGYSYDLDGDTLIEEEYKLLGESIIDGIRSGYFQAVAHPDRIFRRRKIWEGGMEDIARRIINAAGEANIPLEQNESSKKIEKQYWEEFWKIAGSKVKTVHGLDAHFLKELYIVK